MKRHSVLSFLLALSLSVLLAACGGGGGDTGPDRAFPAWQKGGKIGIGSDVITVKFDLSQEHLLGMATKNPTTGKDDPTRIIKPEEVGEVEFISGLVGWEDSLARAPFDSSGTTVLPNTAHADEGYFRIILKTGEPVAFAISEKDSRWDVTGAKIVITSDGALQYGDYHLGSITFVSPDKLHIDFGANVLGGLAYRVDPSAVAYVQWISELTYWYDSTARGTLAVAGNGDYYVDILGMPNNDQGYIVVILKDGTKVPLNPKSPRWDLKETGGITLL